MEMSAVGWKEEKARPGRSGAWVGYHLSRNYAPAFSSSAWAQAVQNKPLGLALMPTAGGADLAARNDFRDMISEQGELEEGEVEVGSEKMMTDEISEVYLDNQEKELAKKESDGGGDFDMLVSSILKKLETITVEEAEASFRDVCLGLHKAFEELKLMFTGKVTSDTVLHVLTQQAFLRIQTVYSVLNSVDLQKREQHKQLMLRLLFHIKNQYPILLTSEQVQKIDALAYSLVFMDNNKDNKKGAGTDNSNLKTLCKEPKISSGSMIFLERQNLAPKVVHSPQLKLSLPKKVQFAPTLNVHADYDEDSLPSPTRENPQQYPLPKPISREMPPLLCSQPITAEVKEAEDATLQPHATCTRKDVTLYQQNHRSFMLNNQLESPTPSEKGDTDDYSHEELSSSLVAGNFKTAYTQTKFHGTMSSHNVGPTNNSKMDQPGPADLLEQVVSARKHVVKPAFHSRDPRARFLNTEVKVKDLPDVNGGIRSAFVANGLVGGVSNTKKNKIVSNSVAGDRIMKRQKLENKSTMDPIRDRNEKFQVDIINPGLEQVGSDRTADSCISSDALNGHRPNLTSPSTISLFPLIKSVNPTILLQKLQTKQQRTEIGNQRIVRTSECNVTSISNCNGLSRAVSSVNAVTQSNRVGHHQPLSSHVPAQSAPMSSQNDNGYVRMKSRDPRRVLQDNMIRKDEAEELAKKLTVSGSQSTTSLTTPHSNNEPIPSKSDQVDTKPTFVELKNPKIACAVPERESAEGASVSSDPWGDVGHLLGGCNNKEKEAIQRERTRRIAEQNKMLAARKLCLVLDLDHTLLNSAKFVEVDPLLEELLRKKEEKEKEKPRQHLFRLQHMGMWTKLRPGIWNFLEKASKLFELHVYTMGNHLYATEMSKLLDPSGSLFAGRVISRGDDGDHLGGDEKVPKSKDLDGVLGLESGVVIIDDTLRVWPHNKLNLILVERYTYFPSSRRQFGLHGPSLLQIDHDERPEDGTLATSLAVIERIHENFFSHPSLKHADVRSILAAEQRKVLAGCRIIFSRVFPVGEANPHLHPLWQTAEQFGAVCTNRMEEHVTHVVANSLGTDKVNWALSTGRFIVQPSWVEASALLYRRAKEQDFAVRTLR